MKFEKIKVLEGREKKAVVLVHCWTADPRHLYEMAELFNKAGFWVFIPLLTGHGTKPQDLENVSWKQWLTDVEVAIIKARVECGIEEVYAGGISLGGNLSLLASVDQKLSGVFLIGSPIHIRFHFWISFFSRILLRFKKYVHKTYPKNVGGNIPRESAYTYFPVSSAQETMKVMKETARSLQKITIPVLIIQTNNDYMVAKYSPWLIYKGIASKIKKIEWMQSRYNSHVLVKEEVTEAFELIIDFISDVKRKKKK